MSQRFIRLVAPIVLLGTLVACSPPAVPEQLPFAEPGVDFSVAPTVAACAADGTYNAEVSWNVPGAMSSKIEVQVGAVEPQVFARSNELVGNEKTGAWVSEGMLFVLRDRDTDMVLAALKAGPGQCGAVAGLPIEETDN